MAHVDVQVGLDILIVWRQCVGRRCNIISQLTERPVPCWRTSWPVPCWKTSLPVPCWRTSWPVNIPSICHYLVWFVFFTIKLPCKWYISVCKILNLTQCCWMGLYHIGHKPYRPHEKTILATMNNHIGHRKNVLLFSINNQKLSIWDPKRRVQSRVT